MVLHRTFGGGFVGALVGDASLLTMPISGLVGVERVVPVA